MLFASLRDLQWRASRFVIGIAGTALAFAVTLLMTGLSDTLAHEADDLLSTIRAETWVVSDQVAGPFTGLSFVPSELADAVAATAGVEAAEPLILLHETIRTVENIDVVLLGHVPDGLASPPVDAGRSPLASGEAVVDAATGLALGGQFTLGSGTFNVTGITHDRTIRGGIPVVWIPIEAVQGTLLQGLAFGSVVVVQGTPATLPDGLRMMSPAEVRDDLLRPLGRLFASIDLIKLALWVVATALVGSVVYLTARERLRDFAVFKAVGVSSLSLYAGLALQATVIALCAGILGAVIAVGLIPIFPVPLSITGAALATVPVVAVVVGLVASAASLRQALRVDPALAFAGG